MKLAGFCLIIIPILFVVEYFLVDAYFINPKEYEFVLEGGKVVQKFIKRGEQIKEGIYYLKMIGGTQVFLLFVAGMGLLVSSENLNSSSKVGNSEPTGNSLRNEKRAPSEISVGGLPPLA